MHGMPVRMPQFFRIICLLLLLPSYTDAATPIDGWYMQGFGGYAYLPSNIDRARYGVAYKSPTYESEYNAGGSFGYKSNPMRYEGQVTYISAMLDQVYENGTRDPRVAGYNNAIIALANVYYDFQMRIPAVSPFIGVGLGYGWINVKVDNSRLSAPDFRVSESAFTYQGTLGVTLNFAENYALYVAGRYLRTNRVFFLGMPFQAYLANIGVVYRYDEAKYK